MSLEVYSNGKIEGVVTGFQDSIIYFVGLWVVDGLGTYFFVE